MSVQNWSENILLVELPAEPKIRNELDKVTEIVRLANKYDVVIDFSHVDIMISLTLSGFLKLRDSLAGAGRRLIFCSTVPITRDIFRVTCFDGIFEFVDDRAAALQMLESFQQPSQTAEKS